MKCIKFLLLFVLFYTEVFAHDIQHISSFTDRNGLSQNTVRCLMQDSKGFMWLGTVNGLNRFDGKEFTVIQAQSNSSLHLSDKRIRNITEDKNGFIWVRTFSNTMFCYDSRLEAFIDYYPENSTKVYSNIKITSEGDVWLWGSEGCCRVQYLNGKLQSWNPAKKISAQPVSFVFEDSEKNIWFSTEKELFKATNNSVVSVMKDANFFSVQETGECLFFITDNYVSIFDIKSQSFLSNIPAGKNESLTNSRSCLLNNGLIMIATKSKILAFDTQKKTFIPANPFFKNTNLSNASFQIDNKGNIWVFNMSGILWRHTADNTFEPLELFSPDILSLISLERYQIYHDSRDIVWITTFGNGLFALDLKNRQTYHYVAEKDLPTNYLLCVTEDHSGEIWVGAELAGVSKISLTSYPFDVFYPTSKDNGNNDRDNAVRLIYEDSDGMYWIGTRDGNLHICDSLFNEINLHRIKGGLPFTIAEDTLGYKWLGTKGDGVLLFSPKGNTAPKTYKLQDKERQSSSSNNIFSIIRDSKNRMWAASFGGGLHLAERHNNELSFRQIYLQKDNQNMLRSMIQDHTGLMWAGCNEGVIVFDPDEIILDETKYLNLHLNANNSTFSNNEVRVVFEDSHQQIWLGTAGGGLSLLVRKTPIEQSVFEHFDAKNGLSNEMIQAIQEDNDGYIWVSTESGISKFNPETERFDNFIFSNNRQAAIFNELSSWKNKNGELMFGSYNGIFIFDPAKITYDAYAPPVLMTGLRINGHIMTPGGQDSPLSESIIVTKEIVLNHNQNSFNLEFTMPNFHAPELNQYMYILDGFEKDWNPISRNNIAAYRNLPPGTYLFKVKGCNSFGVWNDHETTLQIVVRPPWWKSTWAIVMYIILLTLLVYFTVKIILKIHRLNTAVEVEKQLTEYKLRFFTNISHEFRTPLTIIRGAIESLENMENLSLPIKKQLHVLIKSSTRLYRLIEQLLEFRRLQNDKMELQLEPTEATSFFFDIYQTFKDLAEKKQIEFRFETNESKYDLLLDKSKMDKVVYNLLSNALKNTPQGGKIVLTLDFSTANDTFTLNVSDSGPGIPHKDQHSIFERFKQVGTSTEGTGIGLHLTSELVKIHKGNISCTDSDLGGCSFTVTLPLSDNNYDTKDIIIAKESVTENAIDQEIAVDAISDEDIENASLEKPFSEYKVMVIEDDDDVRNFLESQLSQYFTVSAASNGAEGLEKVIEEQPNIVVCDVMMPEMDGYQFTQSLKSNFEISHIPVILLTAYSSKEHQLKGIESGADSYITKPFSGKYLLTRIVKLIEQREKLQHKFATEPGLVKPAIGLTDRDKIFLDQLHKIIDDNYTNPDLKLETFSQSFMMGRTSFFRKVKGITSYTPSEYLRVVRMKKAAELLINTNLNISEISFQIGINDPFYLSRCFKSQFGMPPSQYRNNK